MKMKILIFRIQITIYRNKILKNVRFKVKNKQFLVLKIEKKRFLFLNSVNSFERRYY